MSLSAITQGFIFRCGKATEKDCFDLMLFGEASHKKSYLSRVKKGDYLFLYNVHSGALYGVFIATSDITENIVPEAWHGNFPLQVKVQWHTRFSKPLSTDQAKTIVQFSGEEGHLPREKLNPNQVRSLINIFKTNMLRPYKDEFREKYPPRFCTLDGHSARSFNEVVIDDWLFAHRICHGNEDLVPIPERMYCDFFLPLPNKKGMLYIEYWGMEDGAYEERKREKIELYKKHGLPLIELTPADVDDIDTVLPEKLKEYFKL